MSTPTRDGEVPEGGRGDEVRVELGALGRLAGPLVLTNLGNMALALVDVAVVGRLGETSIAAAGLGNAIFFTTTLFGLGMLFGLDPMLGQAAGAKETDRTAHVLATGVHLAVLVSIPLALIVIALAMSVGALGAPEAAVEPTRAYLYARLPSIAPFLVLMAVRSFLQATGHTRSLVEGVVVANLINPPVAWALALGVPALGFEGLGVFGAGLASGIATVVQLVVSARPLFSDPRLRKEGAWRADPVLMKRAVVLGAPIGLQIVIEAGSFALVTFLVGHHGTRPLSGHQIALSIVSCTFQIALGVAAATSVRVGMAIGRRDARATRRAGLTGIGVGTACMIGGSLLLFAAPRPLARALTDDPHVIEAALPYLFVAACFQLADGAQTVAQGALRGAGDTRFPLFVNVVGHWIIGLPLGVGLAFGLGLGPVALWWGLSAGLLVVALAATARFFVITRGLVARV